MQDSKNILMQRTVSGMALLSGQVLTISATVSFASEEQLKSTLKKANIIEWNSCSLGYVCTFTETFSVGG